MTDVTLVLGEIPRKVSILLYIGGSLMPMVLTRDLAEREMVVRYLKGDIGPPGPSGGSSVLRTSASAVGGHRMVRSTSSTTVEYADSSNASHGDDTLGLTTNAAAPGDDIGVISAGSVTNAGWSWTKDLPVFLAQNGSLSQVTPDESNGDAFYQVVGFAEDTDTLFVQIQPPIYF